MAFKTERGTFVHIPKCAGQAIRQALPRGRETGDYHGLPNDIENGFSVVRHPVFWLRSLWAYRTQHEWAINKRAVPYWPNIVALTQWGAGLSWDEFIYRVSMETIGLVGTIFGMYDHPSVKVYQLENLVRLEYDYNIVVKRVHITPNKPAITRGQWEAVCFSESETIQKYGYQNFKMPDQLPVH